MRDLVIPCPNNIHSKISLQFTLKHTQDTISVCCIYKHIKAGRVWLQIQDTTRICTQTELWIQVWQLLHCTKMFTNCSSPQECRQSIRNRSTTWNDLTSNFVFEMAHPSFHNSQYILSCFLHHIVFMFILAHGYMVLGYQSRPT